MTNNDEKISTFSAENSLKVDFSPWPSTFGVGGWLNFQSHKPHCLYYYFKYFIFTGNIAEHYWVSSNMAQYHMAASVDVNWSLTSNYIVDQASKLDESFSYLYHLRIIPYGFSNHANTSKLK